MIQQKDDWIHEKVKIFFYNFLKLFCKMNTFEYNEMTSIRWKRKCRKQLH